MTIPPLPTRRVQSNVANGSALLVRARIDTLLVMASVVFFRAVNVAGHQTFQPGKLAKELATFGIVNIGAAGTFVVRENVAPTKLREEILRRLPFKPELMICPVKDVLALARGDWFADAT